MSLPLTPFLSNYIIRPKIQISSQITWILSWFIPLWWWWWQQTGRKMPLVTARVLIVCDGNFVYKVTTRFGQNAPPSGNRYIIISNKSCCVISDLNLKWDLTFFLQIKILHRKVIKRVYGYRLYRRFCGQQMRFLLSRFEQFLDLYSLKMAHLDRNMLKTK
jgi:hypothetical protein